MLKNKTSNHAKNSLKREYSSKHDQNKSNTTDILNSKDVCRSFRRTEIIGRGKFGVVYKGYHMKTKGVYAIKVLSLESDLDEVADIQREIQFLVSLKQVPNITRYYASYLKDTSLWIIMEYCAGGSVRTLLRPGKIDEKYIAVIMRELLVALHYIHKDNVIHRDIKAANLLITNEGNVKLCDFGVAAQLNQNTMRRQTMAGTPYWMAPEVIMEGISYDTKADIWSVGITAYEIATGNPPFCEMEALRAMQVISKSKPARLEGKNHDPLLKEFIAMCLDEDPQERPTADKLLHESAFIKHYKNTHTSVLKELISRYLLFRDKYANAYNDSKEMEEEVKKENEVEENIDLKWDFDSLSSRDYILENDINIDDIPEETGLEEAGHYNFAYPDEELYLSTKGISNINGYITSSQNLPNGISNTHVFSTNNNQTHGNPPLNTNTQIFTNAPTNTNGNVYTQSNNTITRLGSIATKTNNNLNKTARILTRNQIQTNGKAIMTNRITNTQAMPPSMLESRATKELLQLFDEGDDRVDNNANGDELNHNSKNIISPTIITPSVAPEQIEIPSELPESTIATKSTNVSRRPTLTANKTPSPNKKTVVRSASSPIKRNIGLVPSLPPIDTKNIASPNLCILKDGNEEQTLLHMPLPTSAVSSNLLENAGINNQSSTNVTLNGNVLSSSTSSTNTTNAITNNGNTTSINNNINNLTISTSNFPNNQVNQFGFDPSEASSAPVAMTPISEKVPDLPGFNLLSNSTTKINQTANRLRSTTRTELPVATSVLNASTTHSISNHVNGISNSSSTISVPSSTTNSTATIPTISTTATTTTTISGTNTTASITATNTTTSTTTNNNTNILSNNNLSASNSNISGNVTNTSLPILSPSLINSNNNEPIMTSSNSFINNISSNTSTSNSNNNNDISGNNTNPFQINSSSTVTSSTTLNSATIEDAENNNVSHSGSKMIMNPPPRTLAMEMFLIMT
ncbi:hypothetical protein TBLA_0A03570 [Henningerozyma blattae CBS 6284]|uniref:non-specific serine/threonine protein kinase n=1 Tax=Henningerozyma blattae (strain ATCC 34711 / CBS 6284 / DSM 70876 / NBRC 10599 / NRRL Y-10934 / UCD 77-7) TaxID=1071380 RepID=I2GVK4_HENB6|nr:hypothetical protein TBLA_0A03570 [Tetrapisispora blattae CBS 6284]CCH58156.1 hypothetical protein TBLA_0A03570 [Tetrapisispora blattae CBS 6284]